MANPFTLGSVTKNCPKSNISQLEIYGPLGPRQIRGQVSACRALNALPNNVEHNFEAIMEPFRSPAVDRTWVP